MQTNIYDNEIYFSLQFKNWTTLILGPKTKVLEPMNWDKIVNHIPRSSQYFGFWSDFLEDKYGLCFTFINERGLTGGGEILKNIYDTYGDQSEVYFEIGYTKSQKTIKRWRVNLQEYELQYGSDTSPFGGVMTTIEKMPFQGKLLARLQAPIQINQELTMDGEKLTQIPVYTQRLHSKTLLEKSLSSTNTPITTEEQTWISNFFGDYMIIQPDQSNLQINELYQVFNQPCGIARTGFNWPDNTSGTAPLGPTDAGIYAGDPLSNLPLGPGFVEPFNSRISQYNPTTSGLLDVYWQAGGPNTNFYFSADIASFAAVAYACTPRVIVQRLVGGIWTIIAQHNGTTINIGSSGVSVGTYSFPTITNLNSPGNQYILPSVNGSTPRNNCSQWTGFSFEESWTGIQVQAGDCIYTQIVMCPSSTSGGDSRSDMQLDLFFNTISYQQQTITPGSTADGYRIFDVLTQQVECLTGQKNAVKSDFFSQGGFGWKYLLSNGYSLRNFQQLINQPKKSHQELLDDLNAIFCLGIGIQEFYIGAIIDQDLKERLCIEYLSNIFKTLTIDRFEDVLEWNEKHNSSYSYNQFKFGYNKWQGLDLIMQDEFNTQGSSLTQAQFYGDNILEKLSNLIAAGYLIEEQRRNQFQLNPNQSLQEDESWFIVATSEPNVFRKLRTGFNDATSRISFGKSSMALLTGDQVSYTVSEWATGFYSYLQVVTLLGSYYYCNNVNGTTQVPPAGMDWTIGGGENDGVVFTIVDEASGWPQVGEDVYNVTPAPVSEFPAKSYNILITPPTPNQIFAERDQPFEICGGVLDTSTIYNGRLSLKHIRANWRPLIGVGMYFLKEGEIVTTLVRMNSNFTSKFWEDEEFKGNVGTQLVNEFSRDSINKFRENGKDLFTPRGAECKVKAGWNEVDVIMKALCGEAEDDIAYGGLELRDNSGQMWFCHVIDLKYDLVKQILTLQVQKVSKCL